MTDLAPAFLLGVSALVMHLAALTVLVAYFRDVPDRWWIRMWVSHASPARPGVERWIGSIFAVVIAAIPTYLMLLFLSGGTHMTLVGAVELLIVAAWLRHLTTGART